MFRACATTYLSLQAAIKDEDSKSADAVLDAPKFEKPSFPPNPNLDGSKVGCTRD